MICTKCGNYSEGEPAFCPKCGTPNQGQSNNGQQPGYGAPQGDYGAPQGGYGAPQGGYGGPQGGYGAPQGGYGAPQGGYGAPQGGYYGGPQGGYYGQPGGYAPNPGNFRVPIPHRDIAVCVLLTIVTCGIYGLYWLVCLVNDLNVACNTPNEDSGGTVILLSIITCGIYMWFWLYKAGGQVNYIKQRRTGYADGNASLIYLLLSIFGLGIVAYGLIQNELNQVAGN